MPRERLQHERQRRGHQRRRGDRLQDPSADEEARRSAPAPHSIDATVNSTAAVRNVRRRPTRSASRPAGISSAANTIVYALRTHDSDEGAVEANCALIDGKATNRIVVSRNTANTARLVLANTTHGLRSRGAVAQRLLDCIVITSV